MQTRYANWPEPSWSRTLKRKTTLWGNNRRKTFRLRSRNWTRAIWWSAPPARSSSSWSTRANSPYLRNRNTTHVQVQPQDRTWKTSQTTASRRACDHSHLDVQEGWGTRPQTVQKPAQLYQLRQYSTLNQGLPDHSWPWIQLHWTRLQSNQCRLCQDHLLPDWKQQGVPAEWNFLKNKTGKPKSDVFHIFPESGLLQTVNHRTSKSCSSPIRSWSSCRA